MNAGLEKTILALSKSRNDAAHEVLMTALRSPDGELRGAAIRGLLYRRTKAGQLAVLRMRPAMNPAERSLLDVGRGRMSGALRDALLSEDESLFQTACELVEQFSEYDLVATLVSVAEGEHSARSHAATDLTVQLTTRLGEEMRQAGDADEGRDIEAKARLVLESLERSVDRFREHQNTALVEAYMILAGPENRTLRTILESPLHACFQVILQSLTHSPNERLADLLVGLLQTKDAPAVVRNVVGRRVDRHFVDALLELPWTDPLANCVVNVSRIASFAFLSDLAQDTSDFDEQRQVQAMQLVAASCINADERLDLVEQMLFRGATAGRAAAADLLAKIPGDRSFQLTRRALEDKAPEVQAAAARPLRERHVPGVMGKLVELVSSPHAEVRDAARGALAEFSFASYLGRFDSLDDSFRRSTGRLVMKIDEQAVPGLIAEFDSSQRRRQMRAIQAADAMGALPAISHQLVELLQHEDHLVRAAVADALQNCTGDDVRTALLAALGDKSYSVQVAAQESLSALGVDAQVIASHRHAVEMET